MYKSTSPLFADAFRTDGTLSVFAPWIGDVQLFLGRLSDRHRFFDGNYWDVRQAAARANGWWHFDVHDLNGDFEYGFALNGQPATLKPDLQQINRLVPDPFAIEILRFGGYRGVLHLQNGQRHDIPFDWSDELQPGSSLPANEELVIYELPLRWMDGPEEDPVRNPRQVGLGTFDKVLFEHLEKISKLGINAIELLPVADSADTLSWGYGTRFFFAPDLDMGAPTDLKHFIKRCHQRGIRVLLDVVMNHARECPLKHIAGDHFFIRDAGERARAGGYLLPEDEDEQDGRSGWGGALFRYATEVDNAFWSREFQFEMARYWIDQYHIDGFRVDAVKDLKRIDFLQQFCEVATHAASQTNRPFIVIAEDTSRRPFLTQDYPKERPHSTHAVDATWNFSFRDDVRRLVSNTLETVYGKPSRTERAIALIGSTRIWDSYGEGQMKDGFTELVQAVNYVTSHDVEQENEQRLMNYFLRLIMGGIDFGNSPLDRVRTLSDLLAQHHRLALEQIRSAFALMVTSVGIPMFLAGEEFADIHDLNTLSGATKMSDPVDFLRAQLPGHRELREQIKLLITLRTKNSALHDKRVGNFHTHPTFDDNGGERVFTFCRPGAVDPGYAGQVIVVANCGPQRYSEYDFRAPRWPWQSRPVVEQGMIVPGGPHGWIPAENLFRLSLEPFQVRVFTS